MHLVRKLIFVFLSENKIKDYICFEIVLKHYMRRKTDTRARSRVFFNIKFIVCTLYFVTWILFFALLHAVACIDVINSWKYVSWIFVCINVVQLVTFLLLRHRRIYSRLSLLMITRFLLFFSVHCLWYNTIQYTKYPLLVRFTLSS